MSQIRFEAEDEFGARVDMKDDALTLGELQQQDGELRVFYENVGVQMSQRNGYLLAYGGPVVVTSLLLAYREQIFETTAPLLLV